MRIFYSILVTLLFSLQLSALDFTYEITGQNQSILFVGGISVVGNLPEGSVVGAFYIDSDGVLKCAGSTTWYKNSAVGIALWGTDEGEDNGFAEEEEINWYVSLPNGNLSKLIVEYGDEWQNTYKTNNYNWVNKITVVNSLGCTDPNYVEYVPYANIDDNSCITPVVEGCTDPSSAYYNPLANTLNIYDCNPFATFGCTRPEFYEYNEWATIDDGSCEIYWQAMYFEQLWKNEGLSEELVASGQAYQSLSNQHTLTLEDNSNLQEALVLEQENNNDLLVEIDQLTQLKNQYKDDNDYLSEIIIGLEDEIGVLEENLATGVDNPIAVDILEGWNIVGFTRKSPMDAGALFEEYLDYIHIIKDNNGDMFWPEFGFNGIGDMVPGLGYQIKAVERIDDFVFPYVPNQKLLMTETVPTWVEDMAFVHPNDIRVLVKIVNLIGQEVNPNHLIKGEISVYLYSDGTVEKRINP